MIEVQGRHACGIWKSIQRVFDNSFVLTLDLTERLDFGRIGGWGMVS